MPHNNRCRLYADDPVDEDDDNDGAAILCTEFANLPIPMPGSVQVIPDGKGVPLAIRLDDEGKWVRKAKAIALPITASTLCCVSTYGRTHDVSAGSR
jgi:hypothetical protein